MYRFFGIIVGAMCALMLFCGFGVHVYAACPCLTEEVFSKDTIVYAVFTNMKLDYEMKKETYLKKIPDEYFNKDQGLVLLKDFETPLDFLVEGNHKLEQPLEVQKQNALKYRLRANTDFSYTLPADSGYIVTIPMGTPLKKKDTASEKYVLAKDTAVKITTPGNYRVRLTVAAQTVVDRITELSSMGTTLEINPKRASVGKYITLTVKKSSFDFSEAQFCVYLRKQGKNEASENPISFKAISDVELKKVQMGMAELQARIPPFDKDESGVHFAKPYDLLVVARGADNKIVAEAVSHEFSVSSRWLAVIFWVSAIILFWLFAGIITGPKEPGKRFHFDPIWFVSGKYGSASLSLAQILLWTVLVFSASFYVWIVSGTLLDLTGEVLMLLGIAGGSSVIAKITASARDGKGRGIVASQPWVPEQQPRIPKQQPRTPKWLDLFQTEGRPDLYKVQMALFTTLAAIFVAVEIYRTLKFPKLPEGFLTLIGISNGVYLGAKATSKTVFEKLAEKFNEWQEADEELKRLKKEGQPVGEAEKRVKKLETELENLKKETLKQD